MARKLYSIQLKDAFTGTIIQSSGGMAQVCVAGSPDKQTLYNEDGTSLSNPVALTRGKLEFWTDADTNSVDIYGIAPTGHGFVIQGVKPSGNNEYPINTNDRQTLAVIPFSHADSTANTEKDTGFDLPVGSIVLPHGVAIDVVDTDATETILFGILASETGDADGFGVGLDVATAGTVVAAPVLTVGSNETYFSSTTLGALVCGFLAGSDTAGDVGTVNPKGHAIATGKTSVSYTTSAGSDTCSGFILLPLLLGNIV